MRVPGPADLIRLTGRGYAALDEAVRLVPRLVALVSDVEALMTRVSTLVGSIETVQRGAAAAVERTEAVVSRSAGLVERMEPLLDGFAPTLGRLAPVLQKLEPMLARLADTTSPAEIDAVVRLVDVLPGIVDKLDTDILPVLDTLATVAPDLRDLLDVSRELNELIGSVPGLGRIKRRIEAEQEAQDEYRAAEEPLAAPARQAIPLADGAAAPVADIDPLVPNASAGAAS